MKRTAILCMILFASAAHAFKWQDLWQTPDQQAQKLMRQGQFAQAKDQFENKEWAGSAAYRAQDYKLAAKSFQDSLSQRAAYNEGNALAHIGKYEQAIKAYDKALALNPKDQDALFNRKLVEDLMKKNQQDKNDKQDDKQDKQDQDQQNKDDKAKQDKNNQDQKDQSQSDPTQQNQDQQDQKDQDKKDQDSKDQDKNDQEQKDQNDKDTKEGQKDQDKKDQDTKDQQSKASKAQSEADKEKQQAREQWLRLIPDDPGGLLREKFLRDHLRRERG